jgi:hypothetical protein
VGDNTYQEFAMHVPTAFVLLHPLKIACVEARLYTQGITGIDNNMMRYFIAKLVSLGLPRNEFALAMAAMWSAITGVSSWKLRSYLDRFEDLDVCIEQGKLWMCAKIANQESMLIMADPALVRLLKAAHYNIVFFYADEDLMSNAEALACFPPNMEGICGAWMRSGCDPRLMGTVLEDISIPA